MPQRRLYSKSEIAVELERDRATISGILRNIPPDGELNGRPAWFIMSAFRAAYLAHDGASLDPIQERARKDKELADKTGLQNAVTRGELFSGAVVTRLVVDAFTTVRTRLLALPSKVAPLVHYRDEIKDVQSVLDDAVNDALGDLSERAVLTAAGAETVSTVLASGPVREVDAEPVDGLPGREPVSQRRARKPDVRRSAGAGPS